MITFTYAAFICIEFAVLLAGLGIGLWLAVTNKVSFL